MESDLEAAFLTLWRQLGYPDIWRREYAPFPGRRFRFDFAVAEPYFVAVECQGGTHTGGRHTRGGGYDVDCLKANMATAAGWRLFRVTSSMLRDDPALHLSIIAEALEVRHADAGP